MVAILFGLTFIFSCSLYAIAAIVHFSGIISATIYVLLRRFKQIVV